MDPLVISYIFPDYLRFLHVIIDHLYPHNVTKLIPEGVATWLFLTFKPTVK